MPWLPLYDYLYYPKSVRNPLPPPPSHLPPTHPLIIPYLFLALPHSIPHHPSQSEQPHPHGPNQVASQLWFHQLCYYHAQLHPTMSHLWPHLYRPYIKLVAPYPEPVLPRPSHTQNLQNHAEKFFSQNLSWLIHTCALTMVKNSLVPLPVNSI